MLTTKKNQRFPQVEHYFSVLLQSKRRLYAESFCNPSSNNNFHAHASVAISANAQDDKKYHELAARLVQSASVKPGDAVLIQGGTHLIPLMEAVAIEVQKAGGFPNMLLSSDRVFRSFYTEVPDKYLEQEPRYLAEWFKHTDVFIGLPTTEDNKALIADIPEERFAKASKANDFFAGILNSLPVRVVSIDSPTRQDAANNGMDFPVYQKMLMEAINVDSKSVLRN